MILAPAAYVSWSGVPVGDESSKRANGLTWLRNAPGSHSRQQYQQQRERRRRRGQEISPTSAPAVWQACTRVPRISEDPDLPGPEGGGGDGSGGSFPPLWKDRVALYAQLSPEETVEAILQALRENKGIGPSKDEGMEALYAFANFDIWEVNSSFFGGKKMDIGQFERFRRVMITHPYGILLRHTKHTVLSSVRPVDDKYVSRVAVSGFYGGRAVFEFRMSKVSLGGSRSWMVDQLCVDSDIEP